MSYELGYKEGRDDGRMEGCHKLHLFLKDKFEEIKNAKRDTNIEKIDIDEALQNSFFNDGVDYTLEILEKAIEEYCNKPLHKEKENVPN